MAQPLDESDGVSGQGIHGLDLGGGRRRRRHLRRRRQRTLQQLRGERRGYERKRGVTELEFCMSAYLMR